MEKASLKDISSAYNVKADVKDGIITLKIDTNHPTKLSSTGKCHLVASTGGNVVTAQTKDGKDIFVGLNAYIRRTKSTQYVD